MKKCDFCVKSDDNGKCAHDYSICYTAYGLYRDLPKENYCAQAIDLMVKYIGKINYANINYNTDQPMGYQPTINSELPSLPPNGGTVQQDN